MGKSHSKRSPISSPSYNNCSFITTKKQTSPSLISNNSRSHSFLNKRISSFSSFSMKSSPCPKNTPPSVSISTAPNTPATLRSEFIESSDYYNNGDLSNHDGQLLESPSSEYKYINGRRFHNVDSVKYSLPNDDAEMDRLKLQHYLFRYIFQGSFSSPVEEILKIGGTEVLDLGCGPGTWLFEMGDNFPKSNFTGVDLTNTLSGNDSFQFQNVKFVKGNVLDSLPFKDSTFDYVFIRYLSFGFTEQDWKYVINEIIRITKPGGWIEFMEPEFKLRNNGPISEYLNDAMIKDLDSRNICTNITTKLEQFLMDTKQANKVFHDEKPSNFGSCNGRFGELACNDFIMIMRTIEPRLLQIIETSNEEYDQLLQNIPDEMNQFRPFYICHRFWTQKLFPM
ncbi:4071_t:CDS:2 [Funneliformis caledonium]|uniref:4071_t:CDS:1 n=1 Tax=Funneliformis caledonium TaxID=1117310 RepID=A0A9N9AWP6_9GLOM|nr:4071_t:CDS:2 [Funneliformis caledonium]